VPFTGRTLNARSLLDRPFTAPQPSPPDFRSVTAGKTRQQRSSDPSRKEALLHKIRVGFRSTDPSRPGDVGSYRTRLSVIHQIRLEISADPGDDGHDGALPARSRHTIGSPNHLKNCAKLNKARPQLENFVQPIKSFSPPSSPSDGTKVNIYQEPLAAIRWLAKISVYIIINFFPHLTVVTTVW
jgi:hypothetical protein